MQEGQTVEDKLRAREENPDEAVESAAAAREVTVSFNADVADGMPWRFIPAQRSVKVCHDTPSSHRLDTTLIFAALHLSSALQPPERSQCNNGMAGGLPCCFVPAQRSSGHGITYTRSVHVICRRYGSVISYLHHMIPCIAKGLGVCLPKPCNATGVPEKHS